MSQRFCFPTSFAALVSVAILNCIPGEPRPNEAPKQSTVVHGLAKHGAQVKVGPNLQVSKARPSNSHGEVILAVDSSNPARLLAGSTIQLPDIGDSVVAYLSADGGKTWTLSLQKKAAKGGPNFGDPAVALGPDGTAHFACIRIADQKLCLETVSSRDGGKTWEAPTIRADHWADRPYFAVDRTKSKFRGHTYCACYTSVRSGGGWQPAVHLFTSRDAGKTFDAPRTLAIKTKGPALALGPTIVFSDGSLAMAYTQRIAVGDEWKSFGIFLRRSTPGGQSFVEEQTLFKRTFLGANTNTPYFPVLAVDPGSKAFADRLYMTWAEKTPAGMRVMLTFSKDKGITWTNPILLSEQAELKEGTADRSYHALVPSVAVNGAGVVGVAWYDTRDGKDRKPACHFRFRASLDGGASWLPSVRLSDAASDYELNDKKGGVLARNWVGDTTGLVADAAGAFHALWIDNRTGVNQIFTAKVAVEVILPRK